MGNKSRAKTNKYHIYIYYKYTNKALAYIYRYKHTHDTKYNKFAHSYGKNVSYGNGSVGV